MDESYIIPLNDLKSGVHSYGWDVSSKFFEEYGNGDVRAAALSVKAEAARSGASVNVDCTICGTLTVPCDRCLQDVALPVGAEASLKFRFGIAPEGDLAEEDGREVTWLPEGETGIDLSQVIYDYSLLALPLQHCHAEGECDPAVSRYLNPSETSAVEPADSPFAALKGLFEK